MENNPEDILTEPTTPKHTINVHSVNQNTNYTHIISENNNMLCYKYCVFFLLHEHFYYWNIGFTLLRLRLKHL